MKISNPIYDVNIGSRDPFIVEHKGFLYSCYDSRENVVYLELFEEVYL